MQNTTNLTPSPAVLESQVTSSEQQIQVNCSSSLNCIGRQVSVLKSKVQDCMPTCNKMKNAALVTLVVLGLLIVIVGPVVGFGFGADKCLNDPEADKSKWCTQGKNGRTHSATQGAIGYIFAAIVWPFIISVPLGILWCKGQR